MAFDVANDLNSGLRPKVLIGALYLHQTLNISPEVASYAQLAPLFQQLDFLSSL